MHNNALIFIILIIRSIGEYFNIIQYTNVIISIIRKNKDVLSKTFCCSPDPLYIELYLKSIYKLYIVRTN